jgi:hypothetical protein
MSTTTQYNFVLNAPNTISTGWDNTLVTFNALNNISNISYPIDPNTIENTPNTVSVNYSNIPNGTDVTSSSIPTISQNDFQNLYNTNMNATTLLTFTIGQYINIFINSDVNTTIINDLQIIDNYTYTNLNYNFSVSWNSFINGLQMQNISNIPNPSPDNIVMFAFTFMRTANTNVTPNKSLYTKHILIYFKVV